MRIKIFTEAGQNVGLGHLQRCICLFREISLCAIETVLVIRGDFNGAVLPDDVHFENVDWISIKYLSGIISNTNLCIFDSYMIHQSIIDYLSTEKIRTIFLDDDARVVYRNGFVVNPGIGAQFINYRASDELIFLTGPDYVIIRPQFLALRRESMRTEVRNVLITTGGSNQNDLLTSIIGTLCEKYNDISFCIVVAGGISANLKENSPKNVTFFVDISAEAMAKLMLSSDFAISAAGQTIYELIVTKTPFIAIQIAQNQKYNIMGMKAKNKYQEIINALNDDFAQCILVSFEKMLKLDKRIHSSLGYGDSIDGLGCVRIVNAIIR